MKSIKVDFNSIRGDGHLDALLGLASEDLEVGDAVTVVEMFDGDQLPATVVAVDRGEQTVVLDVEWDWEPDPRLRWGHLHGAEGDHPLIRIGERAVGKPIRFDRVQFRPNLDRELLKLAV